MGLKLILSARLIKFTFLFDIRRASSFVSNTFNFVFGFDHQVSLRTVMPVTREEAVKLVSDV